MELQGIVKRTAGRLAKQWNATLEFEDYQSLLDVAVWKASRTIGDRFMSIGYLSKVVSNTAKNITRDQRQPPIPVVEESHPSFEDRVIAQELVRLLSWMVSTEQFALLELYAENGCNMSQTYKCYPRAISYPGFKKKMKTLLADSRELLLSVERR